MVNCTVCEKPLELKNYQIGSVAPTCSQRCGRLVLSYTFKSKRVPEGLRRKLDAYFANLKNNARIKWD